MRWLFARLSRDDDRRAIESELDELYELRRKDQGEREARRSRWWQYARLSLQLSLDRFRRRTTPEDRGGFMSGIWHDVVHAARGLRRSPGLAITIMLTVGLGLGSTSTMLAVIDAVMLRPLPYADPDRLMWIYADRPPFQGPLSVADVRTLDEQQTSFSQFAAYQAFSVTLTNGDTATRVNTRSVTWAYFSTLGLAPEAGRLFDKSDDEPNRRLVVLGRAFWRSAFGADPSVVGRTIPIDGVAYTVVGVVADDTGPLGHDVALFRVVHYNPPPRKGPFFIRAIARLRPGVTPEAALAEIRAINKRMFPTWAASFQDSDVSFGLRDLKGRVVGETSSTLVFMLASVGCVLLIACLNAVNLLLARAMRRARELTIRTALGASRARLLQYLFVETTLLTTGAAAIGMGLAVGGIELVRAYGTTYIPRIDEIHLSGAALLWLVVLAALSGVLMGLVPAIHSLRLAAHRQLPPGARGATDNPAARNARRLLIGAEFAIATPLLVAAALVLTTLVRLGDVPVGVETSSLITASISLPSGSYPDNAALRTFWRRALDRLGALPGVQSVALADSRPPANVAQQNNINLEDHPTPDGKPQPLSPWVGVKPEYFKTVGLTLQEGRVLDARDYLANAQDVVVVDHAWADRFFPGERVLGRRFRGGGCTTCGWTTVVGVVSTVKYQGLDKPDEGTVYWAMGDDARNLFVVIRSDRAATLAVPLRQAVHELDPTLAVTSVSTLDQLVTDSLATPRYLSVLVATFGAAALLLSLVGVYGVMSYFVQQHRRDIGIRLALGGDPARVGRAVVGQGLSIVAIGVALGLISTFFTSQILKSVLFGVTAHDPMTLFLVPATLVVAAVCACLIPARRAARVDPAEVLREA